MQNHFIKYKHYFYFEIYTTGVHDGVLRSQADRRHGAETRAHIRHKEHGQGRGTEEGVQSQVPDESHPRVSEPRGAVLIYFYFLFNSSPFFARRSRSIFKSDIFEQPMAYN